MRDLIGRTLGHYGIVEKIGEGGMGEVYRAHDERLDRDVAVKVLPESVAQDPDRLGRFEREAKAVARLSHPDIPCMGTTYLFVALSVPTHVPHMIRSPRPTSTMQQCGTWHPSAWHPSRRQNRDAR